MNVLSEQSMSTPPRMATSVAEVVASGLCIGCGLCEAVTSGRVSMRMTEYGSLRPAPIDAFTPEEEGAILACCPGVKVEARPSNAQTGDLVWGRYSRMQYAWAGDAQRRFACSTGGALTALGCHLLDEGKIDFVLHVGFDPDLPMRNSWVRASRRLTSSEMRDRVTVRSRRSPDWSNPWIGARNSPSSRSLVT